MKDDFVDMMKDPNETQAKKGLFKGLRLMCLCAHGHEMMLPHSQLHSRIILYT